LEREDETDKLVAEAVAAVQKDETSVVYDVLVAALTEIRDAVLSEAGLPSPNLDIKGCPEARRVVDSIRSNLRAVTDAEPKDLAAAWAHVRGVTQRVTCQRVKIFAVHEVEKQKLLQLHPEWTDEIIQYDILSRRITEIMISKGGLHYDIYLMEVIALLQGAFNVWGTALAAALNQCWESNEELIEAVEKAVLNTVESRLNIENKQLRATVQSLQETTECLLERVDRMEQERKEDIGRLRVCEVYMDSANFHSMSLAPCPALAPISRGREGPLTPRQMDPFTRTKQLHTLAQARARREKSPLPVELFVAPPRSSSLPPLALARVLPVVSMPGAGVADCVYPF
jgi:hypothetical protein